MSSRPLKRVPARLGVGPVSKNAVDAALSVAYRRREPLMLIPTRRQVESESLGGGYVEGWSTKAFANYVRARDPERFVLLCRDHGGPYQHPREVLAAYCEKQAMRAAAESMREDIRMGFDIIHIDTSADLRGEAPEDVAIDRAIELYAEMADFGTSVSQPLLFELGFETQGPEVGRREQFEAQVTQVVLHLRERGLDLPVFMVAQTGTKVVETANIGHLRTAPAKVSEAVRGLAAVTARYGVALKAHNCDYLSHEDVGYLVRGSIGAVNIAPELGVVETRTFLNLLRKLDLQFLADRFLELAYESYAWRKWMGPGSAASSTERAIIAGHYVYNTEMFREIKEKAQRAASEVNIDEHLCQQVADAIGSYATALAAMPEALPM
jgi:tagatose-1,6-bisphosphate aldolase non-catalytic subunit AgaZ/GatZ